MSDQVKFEIVVSANNAVKALGNFSKAVNKAVNSSTTALAKLDKSMDKIAANMRTMNSMKMTGFASGLKEANVQARALEKRMKSINANSQKAGSSGGRRGGGGGRMGGRMMNGAMGMLGGLGAYNFIGMVTGAMGSGMEFESKMTDIKGILENTEQGYDGLGKKIREVGKDSAFTINQMAGAAKFMAMSGMQKGGISGSLSSVSNLGMVGNMSVDRSADIMTNIMMSMGIDPSGEGQSGAVADVITGVMTKSNVGIEEIGQSMAYVGNIAAQTGRSVTETAVAIGILGDNGIKGSRAGTNLRQMFLRLAAPTKKGGEMIKNMKLQLYELGENGHRQLKPIEELLAMFNKSGAGLTEYKEIFGIRGAAAFSALASGAKKYSDVLKEINENGGGLTDRLAKRKMATTQGKILVMKSNWEDLGISMMDKVRPALNFVVDGLTKLFSKLGSNKKFLEAVENTANFLASSMRVAYEVIKFLFNFIMDNSSVIVTAIGLITLALSGMAIAGGIAALANPFVAWLATATALIVLLDQVEKRGTGSRERSDRLDQMGRQTKKIWNLYANTDLSEIGSESWKAQRDEAARLFANADNKDGDAFYRDIGTRRQQSSSGKVESPYKNDKTSSEILLEKIKKLTMGLVAPKGSDAEKLLTALAKIETKTKANLGGITGGTKQGDGQDTLANSSPLSSVANEMSRSIVVNIHDGLLHVEHQYIGSSNGELGTDDIERQLSDALVHIVQDYELGMSN